METITTIPWVGIFMCVMCAACMFFFWLLMSGIFRKQDELNFRLGFAAIETKVNNDEINEVNFQNIELEFNKLPRKTDDQLRAVDRLWIIFLKRFVEVHGYSLDDYNQGGEAVLKKRLQSSLADLDAELNELQEKENALMKSRKKSAELERLHEEAQHLLQKYELLENILNTSEAKTGRFFKGMSKTATA